MSTALCGHATGSGPTARQRGRGQGARTRPREHLPRHGLGAQGRVPRDCGPLPRPV